MLKRILFIFICLVIYFKINAQHNTQFDSSVQINKMAVTGKIWGLIKYYNPVILQKKVDWDMVFINSYDSLKNASTKESYNKQLLNLLLKAKMKPKAFSKIDSIGAKLILNGELSKLSNFSFINDTSNFIRQPDFTWINNNEILSAEVKNTLIRLILDYKPVKNKYLEVGKKIAFTHVENPFSKIDSVNEAYRILALFRYWNIINYYFPYQTLIDKNWDSVLVENIPLFSSSNTYFDYFYRIRHLTSEISDTHADFTEIDDKKGLKQKPTSNTYSPTYYYPPIKVEMINSKLIIGDVLDDSLNKNGTIQKGDELLMINNYNPSYAVASLRYFTANSSEQSFINVVKYRLVSNYFSDTALFNFILLRARDTVKIDNIQGLKWSAYWTLSWNNEKDTIPPYYTINDSLGYINLGKINSREIKKAINKYQNLQAIIFDMRGYPNGFAPIFLPKMFSKKPIAVANFYYPYKKYAGVFVKNKREENYYLENSVSLGFKLIFNTNKKLFPTFNKVYKGKVIVLIDEEAASYAETVCMILKAYAKNAVFIGRPTQGSNGDIINFSCQGELT